MYNYINNQWIIRDGTGMIGKILFAWLEGSNLDCNAKVNFLSIKKLKFYIKEMEINSRHFK